MIRHDVASSGGRQALSSGMPFALRTAGVGDVPMPPCVGIAPFAAAPLLRPSVASIARFYPGVDAWFVERVLPGVADGTRLVVHLGDVATPDAIAIAKRTPDERKVCTMWIAPSCRGRGLARSLFQEMLEWLDDARPHFTVPAERHAEFLPLVRELGFRETARLTSLYRRGVVEHLYNGAERTFRAS